MSKGDALEDPQLQKLIAVERNGSRKVSARSGYSIIFNGGRVARGALPRASLSFAHTKQACVREVSKSPKSSLFSLHGFGRAESKNKIEKRQHTAGSNLMIRKITGQKKDTYNTSIEARETKHEKRHKGAADFRGPAERIMKMFQLYCCAGCNM